MHLSKHLALLISARLYTEQSTLLKCLIHFFYYSHKYNDSKKSLWQLGYHAHQYEKKNTVKVKSAIFVLLSYIIYFIQKCHL